MDPTANFGGMIDSLKTGVLFLPLQFSRNRLDWLIPAATTSLTSRAGLQYALTLRTPDYEGSSTLTELTTLTGRERPPVVRGGITSYEGAYFRIDEILDGLLEAPKPSPSQSAPDILTGQTMPFQLRERVTGGTPAVSTDVDRLPGWIMKAGLAEADRAWSTQFFTDHLSANRQFLTWQPSTKVVAVSQQEFLSFLINFNSISTIKLRVSIQWRDGSTLTRDVSTLTGIPAYSVTRWPVGPTAIGLDSTVDSYQVWLSTAENERLSEVRTYVVDEIPRVQERAILFRNGLGGWDTLRLLGQASQNLTVARSLATVATAPQATGTGSADLSALRVVRILGGKTLTVSTGWFAQDSRTWVAWLADLFLSEDIYLIDENGAHQPLSLTNNELQTQTDDTGLQARQLTFSLSRAERQYSRLGTAPPIQQIGTEWTAFPPQPLLDAFGKRTGYEQVKRFRLTYTATGAEVIPIVEKPNRESDPDYMAPTVMSGVTPGSTPYPSTAISRPGSYFRNTCSVGQYGGVATIVVAAGLFGGETQLESNARAQAYAAGMDTQAYADSNGTCTVYTYLNVAINRAATFIRNNCAAGYWGGPGTIVVAANLYGSNNSQAEADAQAENVYTLTNTQAYANSNGSCIQAKQMIVNRGSEKYVYLERLSDGTYRLTFEGLFFGSCTANITSGPAGLTRINATSFSLPSTLFGTSTSGHSVTLISDGTFAPAGSTMDSFTFGITYF